MSMDRCKCGDFVDTDEFPEAYVLTADSIGRPAHQQTHECLCYQCRESLMERITEQEWEARTA
jgi:hypothetical protein